MNDLEIKVITFAELWNACEADMRAHYNEIPFAGFQMELDMDFDTYYAAESLGNNRIYAAYVDGKIVGYMCVFASVMLHHKTEWQAVTDGFYVTPEYRKHGVFGKLLKYVEQDLRNCGIRFLTIATSTNYKGTIGTALEADGYQLAEVSYSKEL